MLPDGRFRAPPRARVPLSFALMIGAIGVAVVAAAIAVAALAMWVFSMILPVLVVAVVAAWALLRFRRWQMLRGGARDLRRP